MSFQFPGKYLFSGSFTKMDFRRRPFNQKPLVFRKIQGPIWKSNDHGDEGTFQECRKSWIFKKPTIRWDRKLETRGLFRRRIWIRSILSCQNGLNRHMEQNIICLPKNQFFQFLDLLALKDPFFGGWGHFPKWIFDEGRSTRSLWCLEKIQGPIWKSKDHLVMKGLSENVKNHAF